MEVETFFSNPNPSFLLIGITAPAPIEDPGQEAEIISEYLQSGAIDFFHIRKPDADLHYTELLINNIDRELHGRLVLHSHYKLADNYNFGGMHLKAGVDIKVDYPYLKSRSCHSLLELKTYHFGFNYLFLSPIYNSISKTGYLSNFSLQDSELKREIAKYPVIALGGVDPAKFHELFLSKFAGAAHLGYLWSRFSTSESKIKEIKAARSNLILYSRN